MSDKPAVTVLGLGLMGTGMATQLIQHGYAVTVYNRNIEKTAPLAALGAAVKPTPRAAVSGASIVISMLADDDAARAVWMGDNGALAGVSPGTILIDSSTVTVEWAKELAAAATARQCEFLDAPVTGSKPQAAAGQLLFFVGGEESTLNRVRPVLEAMGREAIHLGPVGSGAMMKLINNFVSGIQAVALAEAISAIEKSGLDAVKAVGVLTNGAPGSPMVKTLAARMMARDFAPNFMLKLLAKDLRYAIKQVGSTTDMEVAAAALATLDRGVAAGLGDKDMSAVVELLRGSI